MRRVAAALCSLIWSMQPASADPHLQILAATCAACHGPGGNSVGGVPSLAGLDRASFIALMTAFRSGARPATVMHRHAKGLTETEIAQLADYFAAQPRTPVTPLRPLGDM